MHPQPESTISRIFFFYLCCQLWQNNKIRYDGKFFFWHAYTRSIRTSPNYWGIYRLFLFFTQLTLLPLPLGNLLLWPIELFLLYFVLISNVSSCQQSNGSAIVDVACRRDYITFFSPRCCDLQKWANLNDD